MGIGEILLIILIILLLFGGGAFIKLLRSMGKSVKEFQKEVSDEDTDEISKDE